MVAQAVLARALKFIGVNAMKYGPAVMTWLNRNPDVAARIERQARRLQRATPTTTDAMRTTLSLMREQVEYLRDSADDEAERRHAVSWAASLSRLDRAVALVGPASSKAERKRIRARIDTVRAEILEAFLLEQIEDAGGPTPLSDRDRAQLEE